MALFGKKKDEANDPQGVGTPGTSSGEAPVNNSFDFDAISRDLDAQNGASSFDALLSQPVNPQAPTTKGASTFEVPENDPLGLGTPSVPLGTVPSGAASIASSPEAVINAPLSTSPTPLTPTTGVAPFGVTTPAAPNGVVSPATKKSFPLVPLLGALGLLAVAGGGAMFLMNSNAADPGAGAPSSPPITVRATAPANVAVASGTTSPAAVQPGIAPAGVTPSKAPDVSIQVPLGGAARSPSATGGLDPGLASRLKALWQVGADAKHNKNYAGARKAWEEALRLRPGHPGFQEAINQLPR